jgi:hypothetical protein
VSVSGTVTPAPDLGIGNWVCLAAGGSAVPPQPVPLPHLRCSLYAAIPAVRELSSERERSGCSSPRRLLQAVGASSSRSWCVDRCPSYAGKSHPPGGHKLRVHEMRWGWWCYSNGGWGVGRRATPGRRPWAWCGSSVLRCYTSEVDRAATRRTLSLISCSGLAVLVCDRQCLRTRGHYLCAGGAGVCWPNLCTGLTRRCKTTGATGSSLCARRTLLVPRPPRCSPTNLSRQPAPCTVGLVRLRRTQPPSA